MAAKTPVTKGTAGWVDPAMSTVEGNSTTVRVVPNTVPGRSTHYFDDLDDLDIYTIANWRGPLPSIDFRTTSAGAVDAVATLSSGALSVLFQTDAADRTGYLMISPAIAA